MRAAREFHYRWEWRLRSAPEALWPLVADTNRFNRDAGLPVLDPRAARGPRLANARRHLRLSRLGIAVEWDEEPFEWVEPYRFGVLRRYTMGPVRQMRVLANLIPHPSGGCRLVYEVWAIPHDLVGRLAIPVQIGLMSARRFGRVFLAYDELASKEASRSRALSPRHVRFAPGGERRLAALRQRLLDEGSGPELVTRLVETIAEADTLAVSHLRPYALADEWGAPRRKVLELCLLATRVGVLEFGWDLLCPLCRGAAAQMMSLAGIGSRVHCDTCNIDVEVNFDRSVELTFHPSQSIRPILVGEYCIAGPRVTPHVAVQQLLAAGETRDVTPALEPGRYRLRTLGRPGGQFLRATEAGAAAVTVVTADRPWPTEEHSMALEPTLRLENRTGGEQLFILERLALSDQAATAAEVTALQCFRDLFSSEALRPGERIAVGSLTVMFTDLHASTLLYNRIGDAPAFGLVMRHFDVVAEAVAHEDGALVKTMGDAVMAVFRRPVCGLRALRRAQRALAAVAAPDRELRLKIGMHYGPCIAVTLNGHLDYFGSTVNVASRLQKLSHGGDVVISTAVHDDPEVVEYLGAAGLSIEPLEAALKGFGDQRFRLWRIALDAPPPLA